MALISRRASYGLRAMTMLAERAESGQPITISELADAEHLPRKFLEQALSDLRRAKLVSARPGPGGGCWLARPADQIAVGEVVRALDGPFTPSHCFEEGYRFGENDCPGCKGPDRCAMRELWLRLEGCINTVLGDMTVADLVERQDALSPHDDGC